MTTHRLFRFRVIGFAAAIVALLAGCAHPPQSDPARTGPFFTPANHSGDETLGEIRRVVVLPVWVGEGTPPESAAALDAVFLTALQQEKRFEVVSFSRDECRRRYREDALSSASALPADLFSSLQQEFGADAVLLIDLTAFSAYKPLTLGLRGKLAAIDGTRLVWTFDNVFSSEAPAAANSARNHFLDRDRSVPVDLTRAALQSPSKFAAYAAASMFTTLPPVTSRSTIIAK
jgi:hypothetical protein